MKVIDGDRDYLLVEEDFIRLYNDYSLTIKDICKKLDLSRGQYRRLRAKCKEDGTIKLRPCYRPKRPKKEHKNYSIAYRGKVNTYFQIKKGDTYFGNAHSAREAELIVERLKECNWDKSQMDRIRKEVEEVMRNGT